MERLVADLTPDGQVDIVAISQTATLMVVMAVVDVVVEADSSGHSGSPRSSAKVALGTCCTNGRQNPQLISVSIRK